MAVRIFIFSLLVISIVSMFLTIDKDKNKSEKKDIALITFENSVMYTMNDEKVTRIVQSTKAVRYRQRDEMFNGTLISSVKSKDNELADIITADFIEKKGPKLKFVNHVKYNRDNFMTLKTDILHYNLDTKIAYNNKPFIGTYYDNYLIGSELYMDTNKTYFKSKKAHFKINLEEKE